MAPGAHRHGGWNKDCEQGEAEQPREDHLKTLPCAQVLLCLGTSALCPAWLPFRGEPGTGGLKNRVGAEVV